MKKAIILLVITLAMVSFAARAQKSMVVDSEKVFKSMTSYNDAMTALDKLAENEQKKVDAAFEKLATRYDNYQKIKSRMTQTDRESTEATILLDEKSIMEYQEKAFGQDGSVMKSRLEQIKPIQDKVFGVINKYATENGFDLVLDVTANPMVLYSSPAIDKTEDIIKLLK